MRNSLRAVSISLPFFDSRLVLGCPRREQLGGYLEAQRRCFEVQSGALAEEPDVDVRGDESPHQAHIAHSRREGEGDEGVYVSRFDGKDVPWKGNPDADTAAAKRIDDNNYENLWKKGGAVTVTAKAGGESACPHEEVEEADDSLGNDRQGAGGPPARRPADPAMGGEVACGRGRSGSAGRSLDISVDLAVAGE